MKRYKPLQTIFLIFTFIFSISAQSLPQPEVSVNLMVTDVQGRFVEGLTSENFRLYENGKEQIIKSVTVDSTPLTVGLLVDMSGSMAKNLKSEKFSRVDWGRQSILEFLEESNETNEYFFTTFSETTKPFTNFQSKDEIIKTIKDNSNFVIPKSLNTSFYDTVALALEHISKAKNDRKVLFILSDGLDNTSKVGFGSLIKAVRKSNVSVFLVAIYDPTQRYPRIDDFVAVSQLNNKQLIDDSGGQAFYALDLERAKWAAKIIASEMKRQYKLSFVTTIDNKKNKWRDLSVKALIPKDKIKTLGKIFITHRKGYFLISESLPTK